jgi:acetyl esterase/lipase
MSVQMLAARAALRLRRLGAGPARPVDLERAAELRREDAHEPPRSVSRAHHCTATTIGGVPATWIDQAHQQAGVLVLLHGGAHVAGPFPDHWEHLARLCRATGAAGLLVDHRRAPEHPYPAALQDVLTVVDRLERERVLRDGAWGLVGDSAGGGLAVATAMRLRDGAGLPPAALVLSAPWLDLSADPASLRSRARHDVLLTPEGVGHAATAYLGGHPATDPLVSPLHGDPHGLPPMAVHVGTRDLLLDQTRQWERRCREAGVAITVREQPGAIHGYVTGVALLPEARRAADEQAEFLREHLRA